MIINTLGAQLRNYLYRLASGGCEEYGEHLPSDECTRVTKIHTVHGTKTAVIIVIFISLVNFLFSLISVRFSSRTRTGTKPTRAGVQMQTDLSYGVQQEQHDTHASWLPRACLFRIFTSHRDNCDFPDILILSHCVGGLKVPSPVMRTRYENALHYLVYRLSCVTLSRRRVQRLYAVLPQYALIYAIHLSIAISSPLQRRRICVRITKCKPFAFGPMIKLNTAEETSPPKKYL